MISAGRPLRFLAVTIVGWVGIRTIMLWPPAEALPDLVDAIAPRAVAAPTVSTAAPRPLVARAPYVSGTREPPFRGSLLPAPPPAATPSLAFVPPAPSPSAATATAFVRFDAERPAPTAGSDAPPVFTASRWSGSAWAIVRPNGRATPFASQLGGSQAGLRFAYAIDRARRLAVTARISTALDIRQREAAIGLDWKPTRLPIHLIAEQRIGIEGASGGPALGAIGGMGPTPVGAGFRLEAYGQAGVIARDGVEGYADGSMRIARPIAGRDRAMLDMGFGVWGGAQREAGRLDIGPSIGASVPVGRRWLRVTADWRERIAGDARPGSGPALSIGTDF